MRASCRRAALALALLALSGTATAQARPFGECRTGYWSSNRNLDDREGAAAAGCLVHWRPALGERARLGLSARLGWQDAGEARGGTGRLREGFVEFEAGPWTARLGRQIVAWGRADRVNPTDSLSPRDLTLLAAEDEEQRQGVDALLLRHHFGDALSLSAVLARFEGHRTPQGSLPANRSGPAQPHRPDWALKLDHTGAGLDASVSYFDGHERAPRYRSEGGVAAPLQFRSSHERSRTLGADFAADLGSWTLRGEVAHTRLRGDCGACPLPRRKLTRAVLGMDRDFGDGANVNAQLFAIRRDYRDPAGMPAAACPVGQALDRLNSEFGAREWGLTLRLSGRFLNERLRLELAGIADLSNGGGVLRPRASYALSDALRLSAGLDRFGGPAQSFFGMREKNDIGFVELALVY